MRTTELKVGMEVGVVIAGLNIGNDNIGPRRGVILECDVYDRKPDGSLSGRSKTKMKVYSVISSNEPLELFVEGKCLVGPWSEFQQQYEQKVAELEFEKKQQEIRRDLAKRTAEQVNRSGTKLSGMLSVLGVENYLSTSYLQIRPKGYQRLLQLLTEEFKNHTKVEEQS